MSKGAQGEPTTCSFCGKERSEHVRLLTANDRSICNYCVAFAYLIFDAEGELPSEPEDPGFGDYFETTITRAKPSEPP